MLINYCEYIGSMSAYGYHYYYCKKYDIVIVIYSTITRIFSSRIKGQKGKNPCCFKYEYEVKNKVIQH